LFQKILFSELVSLYPALHEADITKVADVMESRIESRSPETNLKRIRTAYGCSQSELARLSGVSLRSIQMYEQRRKDINKAQVDTLLRIARSLGCRVEDLTENTGMAMKKFDSLDAEICP
jgi:DNA-binding transcriptional regulator YiaG